MHFNSFLEKHYLSDSLQELKNLLQKLGIEQQLEKYIDDYFNNTKLTNIENTIVQLSFTISNFTTTINKSLTHLTDTKEAATITLVELGIRLIKETYKASNLPKDSYFNTLRFTLQKVYFNYGWDFSQLENILDLDKLHNYSRLQQTTQPAKEILTGKKIYFEWMHPKIDECKFLEDLKTTFSIKKSNVALLFDKVQTDFTITIHSKHLEPFLILIQHFYNEKIILAKGNKGFLKYLETHLKPPQNDSYPKSKFKKICNECFKNEVRLKKIETQISYMLQRYSKKGLLD